MGVGVNVTQDEKGNPRGFIGNTQQRAFQMTKGDRERLRAELAGKAMQALLCNRDWVTPGRDNSSILALSSVEAADALLAELDRTAEDPIKAGGTE